METRHHFHNKPRYAKAWAQSVFNSLASHSARATDTVCACLGISSKDCVNLLMFGDPLWRPLKKLVHHAAKFGTDNAFLTMVDQFERFYREIPLCKVREISLLTSAPDGLTLRKPGFQVSSRPKTSISGRGTPGNSKTFWDDRAWLSKGWDYALETEQ